MNNNAGSLIIDDCLAKDLEGYKQLTLPISPLHSILSVAICFGELQRQILQATYEDGDPENVRAAAIKAAIHALAFSQSINPHEGAISNALEELQRAEEKFPGWPVCPFHAVAIAAEELGELQSELRSGLPLERENFSAWAMRRNRTAQAAESVQFSAMLIRFIVGIKAYEFSPSY